MTSETTPTNALVRRPTNVLPSQSEWGTMLQMAEAFVKSGLLPNTVKTPQAALLIMEKGKELGLPPAYALSNISVVQGKPVVGSEAMLSLIYRDHGDNALRLTQTTAEACVIEYRRRSWPNPSTYSFTIEDARRANLTGKDNWKNYPAAMLRARCISAVARLAFPDSIAGMYTPDELGVEEGLDDHGGMTVIEVTPEPAPELPDSGPEDLATDIRNMTIALTQKTGETAGQIATDMQAQFPSAVGRVESWDGQTQHSVAEWLDMRLSAGEEEE